MSTMGIAVSEDHLRLAEVVADFAGKHELRKAARALLEASADRRPEFWGDVGALGWLGLHIPEEFGGSGYGLEELVVVVEELSRNLAPGPFVPSVITSALLTAEADAPTKSRFLPRFAAGELVGAAALDATITLSDGRVTGSADAVLGAVLANLFLLPVGDDVVVVERGDGVTVESPETLDPTRRVARIQSMMPQQSCFRRPVKRWWILPVRSWRQIP